jgi:DNA-binding beta-propeller fold protein YncE
MHARRLTLATLATLCSLVGGLLFGGVPALAHEPYVLTSSFGASGSEAGEVSLAGNSGVAVNDTTHDVYVADTGNHRVDEFSAAGAFIRAWGWGVADGLPEFEVCTLACQEGLQGSGAGQLTTPTFIAVDNSGGASSGDVYVGDTGTNTVLKFSSEGAYISTTNGSSATGPIAGPFGALAGITVDGSGNLWVYDEASDMFEFAQDGSFLMDFLEGRKVTPNGIDADSQGNLYVIIETNRWPAGSIFRLNPSRGAEGEAVEPVNGDATDPTGFALDRASGELYMDSGGALIRRYEASCDGGPTCSAVETFGAGALSNAGGVAVDSSTDLVYVADSGEGRVAVFGPPPSAPPSIDSTSVANVTSTSANLLAQVNPNNLDTHFHFEYIDAATFEASGFADSTSVPQSGGDLAAGATDQTAMARIQGLQPETTYRYRVVATNAKSPAGGTVGPEGTLTTYASPSTTAETCPNAQTRAEQPYAQALPDCRAYEIVTPVEKGDGALPAMAGGGGAFYDPPNPYGTNFGFQASVSGDGMAFSVQTAFPGARAGTLDNYLAVRGAGGWSAQSITPPQAESPFSNNSPSVNAYSADLSKAVFIDGGGTEEPASGQDSPPLVPGEPADIQNLFLRDDATSTYQLTNLTPTGAAPAPAGFEGASADFSHVIFASRARLTPEVPSSNSRFRTLFEWHDGTVSLVGLVPTPPATSCGGNGPACSIPAEGAALGTGAGNESEPGFVNAVSADGSMIFFNDADSELPDENGQLYVRENGTRTVEISASQKTNGSGPGGSDPEGPRIPRYWWASRDGSRAFFTSCEQLTNDSTANSSETSKSCSRGYIGSSGNDLYQYDTATETLSDLTVDRHGDPAGADVKAVLGVSADGSYVYFVANGVLASGATLGNCSGEQKEGQCNLYVAHDGVTTFIARIDAAEIWPRYASATRVSANGTRLAFETPRSLTGYDNRDAVTGRLDSEVYLYDATSNQLTCVSCNPSGARPLGPSSLRVIENPASGGDLANSFEYLPRNLSEDGERLFFDSSDALVQGDVNGREDVYEYEDGALHLISSGTSGEASTFLDASASGNDVFIETYSQLVKQDLDQKVDIYDARVDGGFTGEPATACTGTGCQGVPPAPPIFATPASVTFEGVGNFPPPAQVGVKAKRKTVKCAKGKRLSHGACVKVKTKKKKLKKTRKASDNRRAKR